MQFAIALVLLVVSYAITALTAKHQKNEPAQFKQFKFPVPDEGAPQAVVFGDVWCPDWQVLWVGNYRTTTIYQKSKGK